MIAGTQRLVPPRKQTVSGGWSAALPSETQLLTQASHFRFGSLPRLLSDLSRLVGCSSRLVGDRYVQIKPDAQEGLVSQELGLRLQAERGQLMLYRLDTGERLLTADEARQAAEQARQAAEAEVARLREELRLRG